MIEQIKNNGGAIVALWAARPTTSCSTIVVECTACGHMSEVAVEVVARRLPEWYRVRDLHRVARCARCGAKGRAVVDAHWALGYGH